MWTRDLGRPHGVSCAFTDMREASRRLSQSLFDAYDPNWVGEEDLGAIVEVSKLPCPIFKSEQLRIWKKKTKSKVWLSPFLINN